MAGILGNRLAARSTAAPAQQGDQGEGGKAIHATDVFSVNIISRFKSLYLTGKLGFKRLRVTQGNVINAGLAGDKIFPGGSNV